MSVLLLGADDDTWDVGPLLIDRTEDGARILEARRTLRSVNGNGLVVLSAERHHDPADTTSDGLSCSCPVFRYGTRKTCSHLRAAREFGLIDPIPGAAPCRKRAACNS